MARLGKVTYVPNHRSMAEFLLSDRVGRVSMQAAGDIADDAATAERLRPKKGPSSGNLAAGYRTQPALGAHRAQGGLRAIALVRNDVDYAAVIELGDPARGIEGEHVLERAAAPYHVPQALRKAMGGGRL